MEKNNKVTIYLILAIIIIAIIIGGIIIATKQGKKQTKESESNNTINTSENKAKDYDYDNPETMNEAYGHPDAYEDGMRIYTEVTKDDFDFDV